MSTYCTGIDEAGYGPLLGPLAIVAVSVHAAGPSELIRAFEATDLTVCDSKQLHRSGDLAPLERVALAAIAWLTGRRPATAAELFALLDEPPVLRSAWPWMAGAEKLVLPCAAEAVDEWQVPGIEPTGVQGALLHPHQLNDDRAAGINRAAAELRQVQRCLGRLPREQRMETRVDRLGGRRYYGEALRAVWPGCALATDEETGLSSRYTLSDPDGRSHTISFMVDGESTWPLTAIASCIAKYARELHMELLNRYWCGRLRALRPTAGYPRDARRWLHQLGTGLVGAYEHGLVRAGNV